jgi:crotonobetainyl-CoA:carnitine CoA-transferase CaiB-like acyl-CoA transferase
MGRMGFGIAALRALNPAIVHVTMPGFGLSGPCSDFVAYGPSVEPMAGFTALMGYSDDEPRVTSVALPDAVAGVTAAAAVVSALYRRDVFGESALVECALHEGAIAMLGDELALLQLQGLHRQGTPPRRRGNAHPVHAPHGVYRCAADARLGDDAWIAIAVTGDAEWQALRSLLALPDAAAWRTAPGRRADAPRLDAVIAAAVRTHDRFTLAARLQAAGVAAGPLTVAPDLFADAHLAARAFFVTLDSPSVGARRYPGSPIRFAAARGEGWFAAPRLGEHNARVARAVGWSDARIVAASANGAFVTRPPAAKRG